jgi:tRNA pseudouridine38-40 synthase
MRSRSPKSSSAKSKPVPARSVRAVLAYHGKYFSGWQAQKQGERTVQQVFEAALKKAAGQAPKLTAASRTDAGVHAHGQAVNFDLSTETIRKVSAGRGPSHFLFKLKEALNFHLPEDIAVREVRFAARGFSARFDAKAKLYRYSIHASRSKPVFDTDRVLWVHPDLDTAAMRQAARIFIGRHDFTAFSALTDDAEDRRRTILRFTVRRSGDRVTCDITGDAFLQHQVRIMVGTLIEVGKGQRPASDIARLLKTRDRLQAGRTAAPHGLALLKVYY